jgi:hypothetical protein
MTDLEKYELVNKCETSEELSDAIIKISNPKTGLISGRIRMFIADQMANYCDLVINGNSSPNLLTREFGIRQQALYIKYYSNL